MLPLLIFQGMRSPMPQRPDLPLQRKPIVSEKKYSCKSSEESQEKAPGEGNRGLCVEGALLTT